MSSYKCEICMTDKRTKRAYNRHVSMCKFIHSAKENSDFQEKIPSSSEIFNILIQICQENEMLKKRVETLEKNNFQLRRKTVDEYLSMNTNNIIPYSTWMKSIVITENNLNLLFSTNLVECLKNVLEDSMTITLNKLPLKSFTQKPNTFYIFENEKWRAQSNDEFKQLITILSHRVLRKYLEWKKMNHSESDYTNEKAQELDIQYMNKVNGFGKQFESRVLEIRKWMFGKIQISLKNVDF